MQRTGKPVIAVIGAGFAGIGMAIRLKQAGYPVTVFERAADLGGVWHANTYPGAACDVPSHLYSFSFEPNPNWTRRYATQPEILDYLRHCVRKYGLGAHIRFGCGIADAEFDSTSGRWRLTTEHGTNVDVDAVVSACGQLRVPALPEIAGQDSFTGASFHSARWDHEQDLTGKRVGVIGTGATAVQVVPSLVDSVGELRLFQRTPPYLVPRSDRPYPRWQRKLFARFPALQKLNRAKQFLQLEARVLGFSYAPTMMRYYEALFRRRLRKEIPAPQTRAALTPNYRMGCKRILVSDDYYPAIKRANLHLITETIDEVVPQGVRTADGQVHELDVLIYATGFRTQDFLTPMRVTGTGGRELDAVWRDGARAHLGITVPGFPNFFLLYGPNTNLGHNSIIYMLERQVHYVLEGLHHLHTRGLRYLDVRADAHQQFDEHLRERMRRTVFSAGCDSWYVTADGHSTNNWPSSVLAYRRLTRSLDPAEYEHVR